MSNYKDSKGKLAYAGFSFAHSKTNSEQLKLTRPTFTAAEERGISGWISSVLQPLNQEFLHALATCEKRSIASLKQYISHNYPHLKEVVSYYIIALLIDIGLCNWNTINEGKNVDDVFMNIIIEDLGGRFYRESQWLTKIMHLPLYQLFSKIDSFSKGYLSLQDLAASAKMSTLQARKLQEQVVRKLKGNLGGPSNKIFQENLKQLQLRVDLTSFTHDRLNNGEECSQAYTKIYKILEKQAKDKDCHKMQLQQLELAKTRKTLEELQFNCEDYHIRSISKDIVQPTRQPYDAKHIDFSHQKNTKSMRDLSAIAHNISKTLSQTRTEWQPKTTFISNSHMPKEATSNYTLLPEQTIDNFASRKTVEKTLNTQPLPTYQNELVEAILHEKLVVKAAILSQLQHIKFQKFHNRHHLCSYL